MKIPPPNESFQSQGFESAYEPEICDKLAICEMIGNTQLFDDLDWMLVEDLSWYVQVYKVPAGATIFKEGDRGSFMALIIQGQVEILKADGAGIQKRLTLISKGKTLGEMAIIDEEARSATCVATQDSVLLLLNDENYARIIKERPLLAVRILKKLSRLMSQRLRSLSGQLVDYLGAQG